MIPTKIFLVLLLRRIGNGASAPNHLRRRALTTTTVRTNERQQQASFRRHNPQCAVDVALASCSIESKQKGGLPNYPQRQSCADFHYEGLHIVEHCTETPFAIEFLYTGGSCADRALNDTIDYTCIDNTDGDGDGDDAPPTEAGTLSYLVVTHPYDNEQQVYFEGHVAVGESYMVGVSTTRRTKDPNATATATATWRSRTIARTATLFTDGFQIRVYDFFKLQLLQQVLYTSPLCSPTTANELGHPFGSSQIISFQNEKQGYLPLFASVSFTFNLEFSIGIAATNDTDIMTPFTTATDMTSSPTAYSMIGFQMASNFASFMNKSKQIQDTIILQNQPPILLSIQNIPIQNPPAGDYRLLVTATAISLHEEDPSQEKEQIASSLNSSVSASSSSSVTPTTATTATSSFSCTANEYITFYIDP